MAFWAALIAGISIGSKVGLPLAWPLWHHYPWLIVAIAPMPPFLAHSAAHDPLWVYLLVGLVRSVLPLLPHYMVGMYGREFIQQPHPKLKQSRIARLLAPLKRGLAPVGRRLKQPLARLERQVRRLFPRYGYWFIVLRPNGWMLLLAGGYQLRPIYTALAAVMGTVLWLFAVAFMGEHIPHVVLLVFSIF